MPMNPALFPHPIIRDEAFDEFYRTIPVIGSCPHCRRNGVELVGSPASKCRMCTWHYDREPLYKPIRPEPTPRVWTSREEYQRSYQSAYRARKRAEREAIA